MEFTQQLASGAAALGVTLSEQQLDDLLRYQSLLVKWNKAYNLTAISDPDAIITKHLLDSLSIIPYLQGQRWIDIGAGAGLPGIPLAIALPEKSLTLLDSNGKKTRFLFHVALELKLDNVEVQHMRAEAYHPRDKFDGILTRAVSSIDKIVSMTEHLLAPKGKFWAMKGEYPEQELSVLGKDYKVASVIELQVPGVDEARHLVEISRA